MSVFKYHAFIYFLRPPPWRTEQLQHFNPAMFYFCRTLTLQRFIAWTLQPCNFLLLRQSDIWNKIPKSLVDSLSQWDTSTCCNFGKPMAVTIVPFNLIFSVFHCNTRYLVYNRIVAPEISTVEGLWHEIFTFKGL